MIEENKDPTFKVEFSLKMISLNQILDRARQGENFTLKELVNEESAHEEDKLSVSEQFTC